VILDCMDDCKSIASVFGGREDRDLNVWFEEQGGVAKNGFVRCKSAIHVEMDEVEEVVRG